MAETIKGINVTIGSDTTGLSAALSDVNKHARNIQSELKQVEQLLKMDPSNTELLAQKQKLLGDSISNTREKLDQLKAAQQQVNAQFAKGDITEGQYRAFQREVAKTEQDLKGFEGRLKQTESALKDQSKAVSKLGKDYKDAFDEASTSMNNSFNNMKVAGAGITAAGAGIALGLGSAASKAADFEQQMSNVKSVMSPTDIQKFGGELEKLAIQMGSDTKYSATEAAKGIEELVKAGVSMDEIMGGGLAGALSLATAGELEVADAAEIASTALNAFRDDSLSVQQAADILAGAANASATSVSELKFGLSAVSAVASSVGLSFEDTTTALAAFAQNGLKGSDAGTSLKTMLMNLQPSTKAQVKEFESLGLVTFNTQKALEFLQSKGITPFSNSVDGVGDALRQYVMEMSGAKKWTSELDGELATLERQIGFTGSAFYDQNGSLKSVSDIAGILQEKLSGMTDAQRLASLEIMFGSDAIRAANILYKEGADGIQKMNDSMGQVTSAEVAAERMNNLKGSIEQLKGAAETAQIALGNSLLPVIKSITEAISILVDGFNSLPPSVQTAVAILGAIVGVLALIAGPLLLLIGFIPQIMAGFTMLAPVFAALTGPVGLIIAGVAALVAGLVVLWNTNEGFRNAVIAAWEAIKAAGVAVWDWLVKFFSEDIPNAFNAMIEWFQKLPGIISGFFTSIIDGIKQWGVDAVNWVKTEVPKIIQAIIDFFNSLPEKIGFALGYAIGTLVKWGIDAIEWVKTEVPKIIEAVINFFKELPGKMAKTLIDAITEIKRWGTDVGSWIATEVPKLISSVVKFFAELPGKIGAKLTEVVGKITGWAAEATRTAATEVPKIIDKIASFFEELPGKMLDIGKNVVTGLWDGIKSMTSWIGTKVSEFATGVINGFKKAFDTHSPSRVMRDEVGMMIGAGMAQGITASAKQVHSAMQEINGQVIGSVALAGAPNAAAAGATNTFNFDRMLEGAVFNVRNDNDVKQIGRELGGFVVTAARGRGVVFPT